MFGALTGGSVNPARTIGPAVATGQYDGIAIYLIAQLVGGTIAGVSYRLFWAPKADSAPLKTSYVPAE
jgi:glycerol uptake facilitator-like aquaporin